MGVRTLGLALGLLGIACGGHVGEDDLPDVETSGATDSAGDPPDESEPTAETDTATPADGPGVVGVLRDEAGEPLPDTTVLGCMATTCLFGATAASGRFAFDLPRDAEVVVKTIEAVGPPRRAAVMVPVRPGSERVRLGSVYVPGLPSPVRLGTAASDPQVVAAGDGLELTVRRADLEAAPGSAIFGLAARALPPERRPSLPELGDEAVVAIYALHPFAATSRSPIAVRAPCDLPDGAEVRFRTIGELDGSLSAPAEGEVVDGQATTGEGQGIAHLTYLVISAP